MSCLSVIIDRIGGLLAPWKRGDGGIKTSVKRIGGITLKVKKFGGIQTRTVRLAGLSCRFGLICGTSISTPEGYEVLWASDGMLFSLEGGKFYVKKPE